jgi:hypothetical protein
MQLENGITTIVPVLSLVASAARSQAALKTKAKADDEAVKKRRHPSHCGALVQVQDGNTTQCRGQRGTVAT